MRKLDSHEHDQGVAEFPQMMQFLANVIYYGLYIYVYNQKIVNNK